MKTVALHKIKNKGNSYRVFLYFSNTLINLISKLLIVLFLSLARPPPIKGTGLAFFMDKR